MYELKYSRKSINEIYAEFQIELLLLLSLYFLRWKLKHKINTISAAFIADTKSCLYCEIYNI